jgi:hypothetical protein
MAATNFVGTFSKFLEAFDGYAWPIVLVVVGLTYRPLVTELLHSFVAKFKNARVVKLQGIEIVSADSTSARKIAGDVGEITPVSKEWSLSRHERYKQNSNFFLLHIAQKSFDSVHRTGRDLFDISVFIGVHKTYARINDIDYVEYYFGDYWKENKDSPFGNVYKIKDGSNRFSVKTSAYGPTLCQAKVVLHTGEVIRLERYLDFASAEHFDQILPVQKQNQNRD